MVLLTDDMKKKSKESNSAFDADKQRMFYSSLYCSDESINRMYESVTFLWLRTFSYVFLFVSFTEKGFYFRDFGALPKTGAPFIFLICAETSILFLCVILLCVLSWKKNDRKTSIFTFFSIENYGRKEHNFHSSSKLGLRAFFLDDRWTFVCTLETHFCN